MGSIVDKRNYRPMSPSVSKIFEKVYHTPTFVVSLILNSLLPYLDLENSTVVKILL